MRIKLLAILLVFILVLSACGTPTATNSESTSSKQTESIEESSQDTSSTDTSTDTSIDSSTNEEDKIMADVQVDYNTTLIKYPELPKDKLPRDYDYSVRIIQGDKSIDLPVYNPVYASDYFTRSVYNFDQHRRYAEFAFTGDPVTVEITVNMNFSKYTVMPSSKAIPSEINGNVITYTIDKPCTTVLKLNDDKDTHLTIFAEEPEYTRPNKDADNVIYFEAGFHEPEGGVVVLTSDTTLYLEPGALVKARVTGNGENIKICGRGAFIEPNPTRGTYGDLNPSAYMCNFNNVNGGIVEGVRFLEAHCFNLVATGCSNLVYDNVKLLCNQVSTDGLSLFVSADAVNMKNCYLNVSDNAFVIGGGNMKNVVVEDTIVITDYAFLFPQGNLKGDPLVFKNMDVLRYATFMKHQYPRELGQKKNVQLVLEDSNAIDSDQAGTMLTITFGSDGVKDFTFKNVTLPKPKGAGLYVQTHDTEKSYVGDDIDNVTVTFDNVWVGGELFTKQELETKDNMDYTKNNKVIFTGTKDESAVILERNDVVLEREVTVNTVYIGDRRIECEYQPVTKDGKTYVCAYQILEALGFTDAKVANGKLTFSYKYNNYEIAVADEQAMVDTETLARTIGTNIKLDGKKIQIDNIERDDNLLRDPDFEGGLSMNWVTRNFSKLYISEEAYSGKYALRIGQYTWGNDGGVYQDIAEVVRQYGKGKYRVTAWVKKASGDCDSTYIRVGTATDWSVSNHKQIDLTEDWQEIEYVYNCTNPNSFKALLLIIGQCDGTTKDVLVDNVSMTKID